jgi:ubiquinone/menaquinone biosynthesis C-methylase UbiE
MSNDIRAEFGRQAATMAAAPAYAEAETLRRIVGALGSGAGRVLDVACGPGIVMEAIAPLTSEVVGIDATPEMLVLAEQRLRKGGISNTALRQGLAESLPFGLAEFDAIVTRLSFHHFPNLPLVLSELRRVLRPSGRLVVADMISSDDPDESALHNALERLRDPTHVRMLARGELLGALRAGRFAPVSEETWEQRRSFAEWARIIAAPERMEPLREVMRALAQAGLRAGIGLHEAEGELRFTHTWLLVTATVDAQA